MSSDLRSQAFGRRIETVAALAAVLLLAVGCVLVLRPFLTALLWAMILTYATWPIYAWVAARLRQRRTAAALVMTLLLAAGFIFPLTLLAVTMTDAAAAGAEIVRRVLEQGPPPPPAWVARLPLIGPDLAQSWRGLAADASEFAAFARPYFADARHWAIGAGLTVGHATLELSLSVFATFFFYRDGTLVVAGVRRIGHRLAGEKFQHMLDVTSATVRGVVYGTVGGAMAQGVVAALGFLLAEVPGALFLGSLTFLVGLVPGGPPLVWAGVALWLASVDRIGAALFVAVWGFLVISGVDNLIKPYLISRANQMSLLLVFLGVIGGAISFGFIGVFVGPTLLGIAYALVVDWGSTEPGREAPSAPPAGPGSTPPV